MLQHRLVYQFALCCTLTMFAPFDASLAAAAVTVRALTSEGSVGGEVEVPITITAGRGLEGLQFVLSFDPEVLELTKVSAGPIAGAGEVDQKMRSSGKVRIAMYPEKAVESDGTLLVAHFKVLGEKGEKSLIEFAETRAWRFDAQHPLEMLVTAEAGQLTVVSGALVPYQVWIVAGAVGVLASILLLRRRKSSP